MIGHHWRNLVRKAYLSLIGRLAHDSASSLWPSRGGQRTRRRHAFAGGGAADVELLEPRTLLSGSAAATDIDLRGAYSVITPGSNTPSLAFVEPNYVPQIMSLAIPAGGPPPALPPPILDGFLLRHNGTSPENSLQATFTDSTHLLFNGTDTATYSNNAITFSTGAFAGEVWTKISLPANYTNLEGAAVHATQQGSTVTFTDKFGKSSLGTWTSTNSMSAFGETLTFGKGHIVWSSGSVWTAHIDINGSNRAVAVGPGPVILPFVIGPAEITAVPTDLFVTNYADGAGRAAYLIRNGSKNVAFIDGQGNMSLGTFTDLTHAVMNDDPSRVAMFSVDQVVWQDGAIWTTSSQAGPTVPVVTNYTNAAGLATFAVQNGTSQILFVDSLGTFSIGTFTGVTQVTDSRYAGIDADLGADTVTWTDGTIWTKTTNPPLSITSGRLHLQVTSPTTMVAIGGQMPGAIGNRTADNVVIWSSPGSDAGSEWSFADGDQLNALFEMALS